MSYCRWSSDHFECDVYVYADVNGGWTTHVAQRRLKHRVPDEIKAMPQDTGAEWYAAYEAEKKWRESLPCDETTVNYLQKDGTTKPGPWRTPKDSEYFDLSAIGPESGESYNHDTPGECADWLVALKSKGFLVPQYAIDALREEQAEMEKQPVESEESNK